MILKSYIDASYLSESQDRIKAVGYFYLVYTTKDTSRPRGAIMVILTIIWNVMLLAAEAEYGALFYNAK